MGFIIKNIVSEKSAIKSTSIKLSSTRDGSHVSLYKPISEFEWKDADKRERKDTAIEAYKKLAF